jgi:hypothetical protein
MERREANIIKLTQQINTNKIKSQSLKLKMQNEVDDIIYLKLRKEQEDTTKLLKKLSDELEKEKESDKKEKLLYKKNLLGVKLALTNFGNETKSNTKINRHVEEINEIIRNIEKYLG